MDGPWKDMEGMEDRVCNRGCGPFKSHREGVALEGSWKDMGSRDAMGVRAL